MVTSELPPTLPARETVMSVTATVAFTGNPKPDTIMPGGRTIVNVVLEIVTLCTMWILTLLGNIMVCIVIQRSRRLQSTTNYFVVSLACADLCYAILCMPFLLIDVVAGQWVAGIVMCKIVRFLQLLLPLTMMAVLIWICVDRFYTIIYPLSFKVTRGAAKRLIAVSWLIAAPMASPCLYFYNIYVDNNGGFHCQYFIGTQWDSFYIGFVIVLAYFIPLLGIVIGYTRISRFIWTTGVGGRTIQRTTNPVPRAKVKMVKLIILVNIVIVVLTGPFFIAQLWYCSTRSGPVNPTVYNTVVWLLFVTTVAKPIIYVCYNPNFRRGCKEVFCMSSMKCYRSNAYTITATSTFGKRNYIGVAEPTFNGTRRIESPTNTFDRTTRIDKSAWPLASHVPSTYL